MTVFFIYYISMAVAWFIIYTALWKADRDRDTARWALMAPIWPVVLIAMIGYALFIGIKAVATSIVPMVKDALK